MTVSRFIAIDGPNGSGKSSLAESLSHELRSAGVPTTTTREPWQEHATGELAVRADTKMAPYAYTALLASNRLQHSCFIQKELDQGRWVLTDRFLPSSLVLQGLDGVDHQYIWNIHRPVLQPDCTFILAGLPEVFEGHLARRGKLSPREEIVTRQQEVDAYRAAARQLQSNGWNVEVLDEGQAGVPEITQDILRSVRSWGWLSEGA